MVRRVMIECPETGDAVSTGISMDETLFHKSAMMRKSFVCSECGQTHFWNRAEAFLEGDAG